jgi:hypothetical protein
VEEEYLFQQQDLLILAAKGDIAAGQGDEILLV